MNTIEKQLEMQRKGEELLRTYDKLFWNTMSFISELGHYQDKANLNMIETLEWMKFIINDEDMVKITRLAVALQYVKEPTDREVISSLKENIRVSAMNARKNRGR